MIRSTVLICLILLSVPSFATGIRVGSSVEGTELTTEELRRAAQQEVSKLNFKKAIKLFTQALDLSPDDVDILRARGEVYLTMEKYDPAMNDLMAALSLDLENGEVFYALAKLQHERNESGDGLWFISMAAQYATNDEQFKEILGFKGKIHLELGQLEDAEINLSEAALAERVSLEVMKDLAVTYHRLGRNPAAVELLDEIINIFGDDLETLVNAGYISNLIGDYELAIDYFDMAMEKESGEPYALSNKAYSLFKLGREKEARKMIERSLGFDNTNCYAYKVKGDILSERGQEKKACKEYTKAVEMGWVLQFERAEIEECLMRTCGE